MRKLIVVLALAALSTAGLAQEEMFTTLWDGGNEFAGNMFDLKATNSNGLMVNSFDVNMDLPVGSKQNVSIYWREGTYVGHESSPDGWNELGTVSVDGAGENQPAKVNIGGLTLPYDQTIGMYVFVTDYTTNPPPAGVFAMNYSNVPPGQTFYSDANLEWTGGVGKGSPPFTGSTFSPRVWNGNIYYDIVPEPASFLLLAVVGLIRRR